MPIRCKWKACSGPPAAIAEEMWSSHFHQVTNIKIKLRSQLDSFLWYRLYLFAKAPGTKQTLAVRQATQCFPRMERECCQVVIQEHTVQPKASARQKDLYPAQLFSLGSVSSLGSGGQLVEVGCNCRSEGRLRCMLKGRCYNTNKAPNNAVQ